MWDAIERRPGAMAARAPAAQRRAATSRRLPTGSIGTEGKLGSSAATLRAEPLTRTNSQNTMLPESQRNCEMPPATRRPGRGVHFPERPDSLQYHAPSSVFTGHRRREETGVMARLLARAEPTRSDTQPMSEGQCQHISAIGFGRPLPGARGIRKRPRGVAPSSARGAGSCAGS